MIPQYKDAYEACRSVIRNESSGPEADLFQRTSWTDPELALGLIKKGSAIGNRSSLRVRAWLQKKLFLLGFRIQANSPIFLIIGLALLLLCLLGLTGRDIETDIEKLWIWEGGRLAEELSYARDPWGSDRRPHHAPLPPAAHTSLEMVLQPAPPTLTPQALLAHLQVMRAAVGTTVEVFDITWSFKDVCQTVQHPIFDKFFLDKPLENIFPCSLITPLDCFWEGSKLLGPDHPVTIPGLNLAVSWSNLNPRLLVESVQSIPFLKEYSSTLQAIQAFMRRSGITTAYQEKPCLNPRDPACPESAPNKRNGTLDIASTLSGGCYGFATKFMHWPEEIIVGSITRKKNGQIKSVGALQSILQLMGEENLHEVWRDDVKTRVLGSGWDVPSARIVLQEWKRRFTQVVLEEASSRVRWNASQFEFHAFSSTSLRDKMEEDFSHIKMDKIILGYVAMLVYVCVCVVRCHDPLHSGGVFVGLGGVGLVTLANAAAFGLCSYFHVNLNPAVTQIVPFVALGLGINNLFLLLHEYSECSMDDTIPKVYVVGEVLSRIGLSILLSSFALGGVFCLGLLLPIAALRSLLFHLVAATALHLLVALGLLPALLARDLKKSCVPCGASPPAGQRETVTHALPPDGSTVVTVLLEKPKKIRCRDISPLETCLKYYLTLMQKSWIKCVAVLLLCLGPCVGVWGGVRVRPGLALTDVLPHPSREHTFLSLEEKHFGFYASHMVTRRMDYPTNQVLLRDLHRAIGRAQPVVREGTQVFWLDAFRDWLLDVQRAFDREWLLGCVDEERWYGNASDDAILAYKLLAQTGRHDNPVDRFQVRSSRLVDEEGVVNPKAFYNYLSAWATNDILAYSASQANFVPQPKKWYSDRLDLNLRIPKSNALLYAEVPFLLNGDVSDAVVTLRRIAQHYTDRGVPCFPAGLPFTYWEQYEHLPSLFALCLGAGFAIVFALAALLLLNVRAAALMVLMLAVIVVELYGLMGVAGIRFNAIPAILLISAVGMAVHFTLHIMMGFLTCHGSRQHRLELSLLHTFPPVLHGALSTLLGVLMLALTDFHFIYRYFFVVLCALVVVGSVNGLFVFPVILSYVGPSEFCPSDESISGWLPPPTPSPVPTPSRDRILLGLLRRPKPNHHLPPPSLPTIEEENSSDASSARIVLEPEVTVETTTVHSGGGGHTTTTSTSSSESEGEQSSSCAAGGSSTTTHVKVTAKAKVSLQLLHTGGVVEYLPQHKKKRPS